VFGLIELVQLGYNAVEIVEVVKPFRHSRQQVR